MKYLKKIISFVSDGINDNIMVYAAQSAYYLILSAVPFIMILLSAVQFFVTVDKTEFIKFIPTVVSPEIQEYLETIIDEMLAKPTVSLISVSAVTTLWSASRGFSAMEKGVRNVYKMPKRKFFAADILISLLYTVIFTAVIILFLGIIVFGKVILYVIDNHIPWFSINISFFEYTIFFAVSIAFFAVLYTSFAGLKVGLKHHLPGAVFTGAGWVLFSYIFSIYINNFANYSRIYGSLTAIVLMMLWLYSCMIIFLYGAEINEIFLNKKIKFTSEEKL